MLFLDRLIFDVPKKQFAKALDFWTKYGPIIKIAAGVLEVAVKTTSGVSLAGLVPSSVTEAAGAGDFVREYVKSVGQVSAAHASVEVEGREVDGVEHEVVDVEGAAYAAFGEFLESVQFDEKKLRMSKEEVAVDGGVSWQWVASDQSHS